MKSFQAAQALDKIGPQLKLCKAGALLEVVINFVEYVSLLCEFHHQTESLGVNVNKRFLVLDYVFVPSKINR